VKDATGQSLAYVYADADTAELLTMDEARRIMAKIATCRRCSAINRKLV
jgi:hypothetical protein